MMGAVTFGCESVDVKSRFDLCARACDDKLAELFIKQNMIFFLLCFKLKCPMVQMTMVRHANLRCPMIRVIMLRQVAPQSKIDCVKARLHLPVASFAFLTAPWSKIDHVKTVHD